MRIALLMALLAALAAAPAAFAAPAEASPRSVILMIADGMGFEQVAAARAFLGEDLVFESAPFQGQVATGALPPGTITDSAAAATAMATGFKVFPLTISVMNPGDESALETTLEIAQARRRAAGLVTTSYITDATPAAFAAHASSRFATRNIRNDYLRRSRPDVLFGGGGEDMTPELAMQEGYVVLESRAALLAHDPAAPGPVSGQLGEGALPFEYDELFLGADPGNVLPSLEEMVQVALAILERAPAGFFLVVEQEGTDSAGHLPNDDPHKTARMVHALVAFADAVDAVLDWLGDRDDVLLVVTSDHETGGLSFVADAGPGELPLVTWAHDDHTAADVPIYAWGPGAEQVEGALDNTDIAAITTLPEPSPAALVLASVCVLAALRRR